MTHAPPASHFVSLITYERVRVSGEVMRLVACRLCYNVLSSVNPFTVGKDAMPEQRISTSVSLPKELYQYLREKVASDPGYQSASEVVREGLRLIRERDEARRQGGAVVATREEAAE